MKRLIALSVFLLTLSISSMAGVFIKKGNKYLLVEKSWEGSINDICKRQGYDGGLFYTYSDTDKESDIILICFKIFTSDIVCVITNDNVIELREQDVNKYLSNYSFTEDYPVYNRESDLRAGVKNKNITFEFLADVLNIPIKEGSKDTMLISEKFGYKFFFKNNVLDQFTSLDGYGYEAKEVKETMPDYYIKMENSAKLYWHNDIDNIKKEINTQCKSFYSIPDGLKNEFLKYFIDKDGCYNFKIISVLLYKDNICLRDFKDICHGEYQFVENKIENGLDLYVYKYKYGKFYFTKDGNLSKSEVE